MMKMKLSHLKLFRPFSRRPAPNGRKPLAWAERIRDPQIHKWMIGVGTALVLALFLSPSLQLRIRSYRVGDIATREIKSPYDLLVEDQKSTEENRREAEGSVLSVYDYDPVVLTDAERLVQSTFTGSPGSPKKGTPGANAGQESESSLRPLLTSREWRILTKERFNPSLGEAILDLVTPVLRKGIVSDKELLDPDAEKGIVERNVQTREERTLASTSSLLDLREAKARIRTQSGPLLADLRPDVRAVLVKIAENLVKPNLSFNKGETEDRKVKARTKVSPVYFQVKRGEVILRRGDRVREDHLVKIHALQKAQERSNLVSMLIGFILLTLVVLTSLYQFSSRNIRKFALSRKDMLFFSTTLVAAIGLLRLFQMITDILGGEFLSIPSSSYQYLFPIATGAMLIRIVLNSEVAIVYTILASYFASVLVGNQLFMFIFTFIGSIVGAHRVAQCEQRGIIIKAGLVVGGINVLMVFAYQLISGGPLNMVVLSDLGMGFLAGPLASVLVLGVAPIIESLFGYTTDIKLLELANMDNPLLKDLILQAPGTYHHCVIVGTLVEGGAKSVSANPLLARVSAYYHDIGKLKKPLYFIENAGGIESKHDHLTPHMSSLILLSHVKDGIELARDFRLGERIESIIQQHHGTSLISYFYQKAKEHENPEMESLEEDRFRYPGPKPQTKEAGIVMLADAVEATSRNLSEPTPARIKSLVQGIINNIFLDGQLEECELTLKDLHKIEESFTRTLLGIFHRRIDYPAVPAPESARKDEDLDSKPSKTYPLRLAKNPKGGAKDLSRIGGS
jgi:putative nucleotidyltransferase with HDIG domain